MLLGWQCTIITIFIASLFKNSYRTQIEHPSLLNDSTCNSRKQENSENSTGNLVSEEIKPLDNIAHLQNNNSACHFISKLKSSISYVYKKEYLQGSHIFFHPTIFFLLFFLNFQSKPMLHWCSKKIRQVKGVMVIEQWSVRKCIFFTEDINNLNITPHLDEKIQKVIYMYMYTFKAPLITKSTKYYSSESITAGKYTILLVNVLNMVSKLRLILLSWIDPCSLTTEKVCVCTKLVYHIA